MSRELIRSSQARLPSISQDRLPRRLDRHVKLAYNCSVEAAARVQGAAVVTQTAVALTAALAAEEDRLARQTGNRALEMRLGALVDSFTNVACQEIARLGCW